MDTNQAESSRSHVAEVETQLRQSLQREQLLASITQRIRSSLDPEEVLKTTVEEVRQLLKTDRVLLYQFTTTDWAGEIAVESVIEPWRPILGLNIQDNCFRQDHAHLYEDGHVRAIDDIYNAGLAPCHVELLTSLQVKANLVVPILHNEQLWGLLIAQNCRGTRNWQEWEISLLRQISTVLAIAIQQASLFNQLQTELAERKAVSAALQTSRERLRTIVSSAPIALLAINQHSIITLSSGTILHRLGRKSSDLVGVPVAEAYAHLPTLVKDFQRALAGNTFTSSIEYQDCILEVRHSPQMSPTGEVTGIISVATDVTEQKQAEIALRQSEVLRQSEEKQRALLDAIPDAIFRIHRDGTYLDFKPSKTENDAKLPNSMTGKQVSEVLPPNIAQQFMEKISRTLETGNSQVLDYQFQNGKLRDYEARMVVNGADEILAIVRDMSERKKVERLKNEFVSTVSHELRTPLTSIRGSLGLILGGVAGEISSDAKNLIDIAYKNSERLVLLINDILDIEKIESGKMNFTLKPVELMPLIERAIEANQAYAEPMNVTFKLSASLQNVMVNLDSERFIQVLTNLLSNAAKFSPPGETVFIDVTRHQQMVRISVQDRGPGIPEEFRDRIFQKFAQADSSDSRQKGGTGLGLSIAKAIMERLSGQIGFETEVNVGTTFYCDLPEWFPSCKVAPEVAASPIALTSKSIAKILVCEDDHDIAMLLQLMLQQEGFEVDIAHDAGAAKQLLSQNAYHAMTLDLALPEQDGIALMRELRSQEHTQFLPIIVVSAKAQQGKKELGETEVAVMDWLDKPIDQKRLIAVCKQAVSQSQDSQPRILHIEDNSDIFQVVAMVLKGEAEVHHAMSLQQGRHKLEEESFDLIILDLGLPDGSGLELLPFTNRLTGLPIPVVLFSAREVSTETACEVTASLVKSRTSNQELLNTVRSLVNHHCSDSK